MTEYEAHQKLNFQPEVTLFSINVKGYLAKYGSSLGVDATGSSSSGEGSGGKNSTGVVHMGGAVVTATATGGITATGVANTTTALSSPSSSLVWSLSFSSLDQLHDPSFWTVTFLYPCAYSILVVVAVKVHTVSLPINIPPFIHSLSHLILCTHSFSVPMLSSLSSSWR